MLHDAGLMTDGCFGLVRGGECLLLFPDVKAACAFVCASVRGALSIGRVHEARWGVTRLGGPCAGGVLIAFPACATETVVAWAAAGLH
jgi:hypothetical protein